MAVPEQTPYIEHTGNGITTSFALGFQCETKDHLIVLVDDIEPPIATWSLTGGNVVFTTAPAAGKKITLQRNTPFSRNTDYQSYNNSFRPPAVNKDFDWIWLKLQELGVADWLLRLYVDRLHQQQEQKINDLKVYVDDRDDELRAYLMEEIRKQGVALDQLDEYYNYLMQRLAQIAVDKGWDASFVVDSSGLNQQEINKGLNSLTELAEIEKPKDGTRVYVNSIYPPILGTGQPFSGGGYYRFSTESNRVADGFIVIDTPTGKWLKQFDDLTVEDFGAYGNGVDDDSNAFNAYALSPYTGLNIRLSTSKRVYMVKKQVDCKGKGIIGGGFGKQNADSYNTSSIKVDGAGSFENATPQYNSKAFINVGAEIRDLQLIGVSAPTVDGVQISGFNTTISNVGISGFRDQVYVHHAPVAFRVNDFTSISAGQNSFHFLDSSNTQSTTAYFDNCSWQWGNCPIKFDKDAYGCSFKNIILEYMQTGLTASVWSNCTFDNIWAEETLNGAPSDWLINTSHQQSFNNQYSNLYIRTPWTNRADPSSQSVSNNAGGVQIDNSAIAVASSTGEKVTLNARGLSTNFAAYAGASNNPLSNRALLLTTQEKSAGSNFNTPIVIAAPNGCLWERNFSPTDYTPVTKRRLIGANADGSAARYGVDSYTPTLRKWSTHEESTNSAGQFLAPMMLTFDSGGTDAQQQNNAGWKITKESGTTGVYILQRTASTVTPMTVPNIIVGGFFTGNRKGTGASVTYSLQAIDSFGGSWDTYLNAAGFKIFCRDQAGALIDVTRFTVMFTTTSGV